jgi:hypothetical protein
MTGKRRSRRRGIGGSMPATRRRPCSNAMKNLLRIPVLTRRRIWLAFGVAIVADAMQFLAGPPGWLGFDEAIDVGAMGFLTWVLGFHPLFLPTFVLEMIPPFSEVVPTWTGCVAVVVALRRRTQQDGQPPPASRPSDVIDV